MAFDVESTGVNVETEHILTASLVNLQPAHPQWINITETLVINPGVPVPPESTKIHGLTDAHIQQHGGDPVECLEAICLVLAAVLQDRETLLVGMNLVYDLTILDRNCRRVGVTPLSDKIDIWPVVDTMILDKKVDPYRKGAGMRRLDNLAALYGVPGNDAHDSAADALRAARVAWRIGRLYPPVGQLSPEDIHDLQAKWKREQDANLARWLKGKGRDTTGVDGRWPVRLLPAQSTVEEVPLW